jgi:hypothetical protein
MKPKEKAMELMLKYYNAIPMNTVSFAKQFALIAVDELIEEAHFTDGYYDRPEYWQEVKQYIIEI